MGGIDIASWQQQLIQQLHKSGYDIQATRYGKLLLIDFKTYGKLVLNLISYEAGLQPQDIIELQEDCEMAGLQLIQLWEDIWLTRPAQVLSRIGSLLGNNKKIHGRKTKVIPITQPEADHFLQQFHLQGSAKSRYRFALQTDGQLVAVATFSAKRKMTRKPGEYYSVELIRFATAEGITVQGGLSKLIKHLIDLIGPDDIMSYADLDWSQGKGYLRLGFELTEETSPALIWLDKKDLQRYFPHRLPFELKEDCAAAADLSISALTASDNGLTDAAADTVQHMKSLGYFPVFNTGNKKYIFKCS